MCLYLPFVVCVHDIYLSWYICSKLPYLIILKPENIVDCISFASFNLNKKITVAISIIEKKHLVKFIIIMDEFDKYL